MSMRVVLDLTDKDLAHFRKLARQARSASKQLSPEEIVSAARALLEQVDERVGSDYIRDRLFQLQVLIDMLEDTGWGLPEAERKRVLAALSYFNEPDDLIPDHIPGLGFLDDAIMVELIVRELKPEIDSYRDFVKYRASEARRRGTDVSRLGRADFLEDRRKQLISRMRRRRRSSQGRTGGGGRSPFGLF